MSPRRALFTAERVLQQIRHDRRTIALLLIVPAGLLVLLRYVLDSRPAIFQALGAPLCGLFPFVVMFLITSIAMLRERTTGTLERLMTLPLSKLDLLAGYAVAFGALAAAQAIVVCTVGFAVLGLDAAHGVWLVAMLAVGNAVLGMALGLFVSAFASSEFRRSSSCRRSSSRSCCCAGCSRPAIRWRRRSRASPEPCPSRTPTTRWLARRARRRSAGVSSSTWR